MLVLGEQPGNSEDLEGLPFVGPAGKLLDRALHEAGIERRGVYVTNAVKHFKHILRGKRRLHRKPNTIEVQACRPWLDAELDMLKPEIILCLGATAAYATLGRSVRVLRERGRFFPGPRGISTVVTVHPSALLRIPDPNVKKNAYAEFVRDLKKVAKRLG